MKQENLNGVLQDMAAKFCAYLVRPHIALYVALGVLFAALDRMLGMQMLQGNERYLAAFAMPPIFLMLVLQGRVFCVHFYKGKFRELVPYNPLSRGTFDMPSADTTFYETITGDIGISRKMAGCVYALSKPMTFTSFGAIMTSAFLQNF